MKIPISFGGGSSGSDDVTATAAQVLSPYTAITSESEDEPQMGTMADYAGTTQSATGSLDTSNQRYQLTIPNDGRYTTGSKVYQTYANARSTIGYTDASKVLSGTTFLGLAGTMADKSGTTSSATSSLDSSNSRVRLQIPSNGYYNTSAYLYNTYSNIASLIGLTAAKIKYGETILGITGTWNGYVATSSDLYYNGSVGSVCGSMGLYSNGGSISSGSSCVTCDMTSISNSSNAGVSFSSTLNCGAYNTLTLTYNITQATGSGAAASNCYMAIGLYTSRPTSGSAFDTGNAAFYATNTSTSSTGSKTVSIDISGISSNYYVGAFACRLSTSSSYAFIAEITRIQVS